MKSKFDDVIDWAMLRDQNRIKAIQLGVLAIYKDHDDYKAVMSSAWQMMTPTCDETPDQIIKDAANFCSHLVIGLRGRGIKEVVGREEHGYELLQECLDAAWEHEWGLDMLEKGLFTCFMESAKDKFGANWMESARHCFLHLMTASLMEMARQIDLRKN